MKFTFRVAGMVFALAFGAACAQPNTDLGLRYRGITADGQLLDGIAEDSGSAANSSAGFEGSSKTLSASAESGRDVLDDVVGIDDRVAVGDTSDFPHRAIGYLSTACTGTLIGPRHVLTAGHCVYSVATNQWYTGITFSPGRDGQNVPYGTYGWERSYAPQGYTDNHDTHYDYAIVVLKNPVGNQVGWLPYRWDDGLGQKSIQIDGYPSDKGTGTEQWESSCDIDQVNAQDFTYRCSTSGGMSGSAVYHRSGSGTPTIYGIHVYGLHDANGIAVGNSATRITQDVMAQLDYWISRNP